MRSRCRARSFSFSPRRLAILYASHSHSLCGPLSFHVSQTFALGCSMSRQKSHPSGNERFRSLRCVAPPALIGQPISPVDTCFGIRIRLFHYPGARASVAVTPRAARDQTTESVFRSQPSTPAIFSARQDLPHLRNRTHVASRVLTSAMRCDASRWKQLHGPTWRLRRESRSITGGSVELCWSLRTATRRRPSQPASTHTRSAAATGFRQPIDAAAWAGGGVVGDRVGRRHLALAPFGRSTRALGLGPRRACNRLRRARHATLARAAHHVRPPNTHARTCVCARARTRAHYFDLLGDSVYFSPMLCRWLGHTSGLVAGGLSVQCARFTKAGNYYSDFSVCATPHFKLIGLLQH